MDRADSISYGASELSRGSSRREFILGSALCVTAAAAAALPRAVSSPETRPVEPLEKLVPETVGEWRAASFGDILIPRAEKAEDRAYDDVLTRYYESASAPGVIVLIAYGGTQVGDTELHRPEACYPVAGFKLRRGPDLRLRFPGVTVAARSMTAFAPDRTEQLLYWSRIGSEFPTSSFEQRWAALHQTLRGTNPDGVLVRLSTISEDREAAVDLLGEFASKLLDSGGRNLQMVLIGGANR